MAGDLEHNPSSPGNSRSKKNSKGDKLKPLYKWFAIDRGDYSDRDATQVFCSQSVVCHLAFRIENDASKALFVSNDQQVPQTPKPEGELTVSTDEAH